MKEMPTSIYFKVTQKIYCGNNCAYVLIPTAETEALGKYSFISTKEGIELGIGVKEYGVILSISDYDDITSYIRVKLGDNIYKPAEPFLVNTVCEFEKISSGDEKAYITSLEIIQDGDEVVYQPTLSENQTYYSCEVDSEQQVNIVFNLTEGANVGDCKYLDSEDIEHPITASELEPNRYQITVPISLYGAGELHIRVFKDPAFITYYTIAIATISHAFDINGFTMKDSDNHFGQVVGSFDTEPIELEGKITTDSENIILMVTTNSDNIISGSCEIGDNSYPLITSEDYVGDGTITIPANTASCTITLTNDCDTKTILLSLTVLKNLHFTSLTINDGTSDATLTPTFNDGTYEYAAAITTDVSNTLSLEVGVNRVGSIAVGGTFNDGNTTESLAFNIGENKLSTTLPSTESGTITIDITDNSTTPSTEHDFSITLTVTPSL